MSERVAEAGIAIRHGLRPGDLGRVVALHGVLYAGEYGFDHTFEAYVAGTMATFGREYDPDRNRLWVAEREGRLVGSIGIAGEQREGVDDRSAEHGPSYKAAGDDVAEGDGQAAQLRWLLARPEARWSGVGRALVGEALGFCRNCGYDSVFLWTLANLGAALRLYVEAGFVRMERKTQQLWGATVTEERYELRL